MFLETWMMVVLAFTYGACAWISTKSGFKNGSIATLLALEEDRIICVHDDGSVSPYTAISRTRKRKKGTKII